ncbi:helix-turn-helix domain-containing protein [Streptomyces formicae]
MWLSTSNKDLPTRDQLPFWSELVSRELAPLTLTGAKGAVDFPAWASVLDLGSVRVAAFSSPPAHLSRTWADVRRSDPGTYQLTFVSGSPLWISQRRQDSGLVFGDMVLFDLSQPFEGEVPDRGRNTEVVIVQLPNEELPLPVNRVRELLARPLSVRTGMGAILARFVSSLHAFGPDCAPGELDRLGTVTLDLAAAGLAQHLGAYEELPADTRRQAMLSRVNAFIDHNLGDPELTPAAVATHHHISLRSLHSLFRQQGETVAASIRRRRLARCHADLLDPRLRHRPISVVAARWGLLRPADFSRAFRAAYGVSPRELRRTAPQGTPPPGRSARNDK